MHINKYNSEGCGCPVDTSAKQKHRPSRQARHHDPTAYEAITTIEKETKTLYAFRPIIYICSPLSGDVKKNQENVCRYCRFAVDSGCIPIAPHLFFPQFMSDEDPKEHELALFMDIALLSKCAGIWVFGETVSEGMRREIEKAKQKKQPIRYFTEDCKEVRR